MGQRVLGIIFSYTVPSLLQDGNVPQLARDGYDLSYSIYTHPRQYEEVARQYDSCLARLNEHVSVNIMPLDELRDGWWRDDQWHYITGALIDQIARCINENAMMFDARPDIIFGNRSISNAASIVLGKNVCMAAAHPRLSQESILKHDVFCHPCPGFSAHPRKRLTLLKILFGVHALVSLLLLIR